MTQSASLFSRYGTSAAAGHVLFREGEPGHHMYVVHQGRVRIWKQTREGPKTLAVLGPGEFFGEMAIVNQKPRVATAEVVEDSKLLVLDAQTFEALVTRHSDIAVRLIKKLAGRLDAMDELVDLLLPRDATVRVILALCHEAKTAESVAVAAPATDGIVTGGAAAAKPPPVKRALRLAVTEKGLAERLGLAAEEVQEVMARLTRLQILESTEGGYLLRERKRLTDFLDYVEKGTAQRTTPAP